MVGRRPIPRGPRLDGDRSRPREKLVRCPPPVHTSDVLLAADQISCLVRVSGRALGSPLVRLRRTGGATLVSAFAISFGRTSRLAGRQHFPDFLGQFTDGSYGLFDVRPAALIDEQANVQFSETASVCASLGWRYQVLSEPVPMPRPDARRCRRAITCLFPSLPTCPGLRTCLVR